MNKPTDLQAGAIRRIMQSTDGLVFYEYLQECLDQQDINNRTTTAEHVHRGQGKAICLDELIKTMSRK